MKKFLLLSLLLSSPALADVQVGAGVAVLRGMAPAADIMFTQPSNILRGSYWYEGVTYIGHSSWRGYDAQANVAFRAGWMLNYKRLDLGCGVALLTHPLPYDNASGLNFNPQAVFHITNKLDITYTHFSDAGIRFPNYGRDVLLLGYKF